MNYSIHKIKSVVVISYYTGSSSMSLDITALVVRTTLTLFVKVSISLDTVSLHSSPVKPILHRKTFKPIGIDEHKSTVRKLDKKNPHITK